jgi:hypothetical protein
VLIEPLAAIPARQVRSVLAASLVFPWVIGSLVALAVILLVLSLAWPELEDELEVQRQRAARRAQHEQRRQAGQLRYLPPDPHAR